MCLYILQDMDCAFVLICTPWRSLYFSVYCVRSCVFRSWNPYIFSSSGNKEKLFKSFSSINRGPNIANIFIAMPKRNKKCAKYYDKLYYFWLNSGIHKYLLCFSIIKIIVIFYEYNQFFFKTKKLIQLLMIRSV